MTFEDTIRTSFGLEKDFKDFYSIVEVHAHKLLGNIIFMTILPEQDTRMS